MHQFVVMNFDEELGVDKAMSFLGVFVAVFVTSCSEAKFATAAKLKDAVADTIQLSLGCDGADTKKQILIEGPLGTKVKVVGEVCRSAEESFVKGSNILFVLDFSGSMVNADPIEQGSCGRLAAGKAIIDSMDRSLPPKEKNDINVGVLHFHDLATLKIGMTPLSNFQTNLTSEHFCGYQNSFTNYQAAIIGAKQALADLKGHHTIYFITDGAPTRPGDYTPGSTNSSDEAFLAGEEAMKSLREALPSLDFNAVYLEDPKASEVKLTRDPKAYLQQLVGPDNFRVARNASDLAVAISELKALDPSVFSAEQLELKLHADGFGTQKIRLKRAVAKSNESGVWLFESESQQLFGAGDQWTDNTFTLTDRTRPDRTVTKSVPYQVSPAVSVFTRVIEAY